MALESDGVEDFVVFQTLLAIWGREGGISPKAELLVCALVPPDNRLQEVYPSVGRVDAAGTENRTLAVACLVEHEQRVIAARAEMPILSRALLVSVYRNPDESMSRIAFLYGHARQGGVSPHRTNLLMSAS